ncbi:MAG: hypothetical protein RJA49_680, partial [Actinomycetota bacterium]
MSTGCEESGRKMGKHVVRLTGAALALSLATMSCSSGGGARVVDSNGPGDGS